MAEWITSVRCAPHKCMRADKLHTRSRLHACTHTANAILIIPVRSSRCLCRGIIDRPIGLLRALGGVEYVECIANSRLSCRAPSIKQAAIITTCVRCVRDSDKPLRCRWRCGSRRSCGEMCWPSVPAVCPPPSESGAAFCECVRACVRLSRFPCERQPNVYTGKVFCIAYLSSHTRTSTYVCVYCVTTSFVFAYQMHAVAPMSVQIFVCVCVWALIHILPRALGTECRVMCARLKPHARMSLGTHAHTQTFLISRLK